MIGDRLKIKNPPDKSGGVIWTVSQNLDSRCLKQAQTLRWLVLLIELCLLKGALKQVQILKLVGGVMLVKRVCSGEYSSFLLSMAG